MADELDINRVAKSCVANLEGFERNSEITNRLFRSGVNATVYSNASTGMSLLVTDTRAEFGGQHTVYVKAMKTAEAESSQSFVFSKTDIAIRQVPEEKKGAPFNNLYVTPQTVRADLEKNINYALGVAVQVAQKKPGEGQKLAGQG